MATKKRTRLSAKSQPERFVEASRKVVADENGKKFERAFRRIVPPRRFANRDK